jgi:acetylornithine/succinyldiaminopimelate/putrescine aminotransferase
VIPADADYLRGIRALCDERGMLMIVDEVQTGFARTGGGSGFEHAGVRPDVVTMAKAMGNGFPVGATWARNDVARRSSPVITAARTAARRSRPRSCSAVDREMRRIDAPALARDKGAACARRSRARRRSRPCAARVCCSRRSSPAARVEGRVHALLADGSSRTP